MTDEILTLRCNNNCISCINLNKVNLEQSEEPIDKIKKTIDEIYPVNDYFGISGGEPTISKNLFSVLKYVKDKKPDLYVFLLSNGRMFCYKEFTKKLVKVMPKSFRVAIPLYAGSSAIHDSITRAEGSFDQTVCGLRNLLSEEIKIEIRAIINKMNYQNMENLSDFIVKEFPKIDRFIFVHMKITGNAHFNFDKVGVRITDVWPYVEKAAENLIRNNISTYLYHFPLCTIPKKYWNIAKGLTTEEWKLTFVDECKKCTVKDICPRIWKTYITHFGDKEFKAIK